MGLWDQATGKKIRSFKGPSVRFSSIAFSSDGDQLLAGSAGTLITWDTAALPKVRTLRGSMGTSIRQYSVLTAIKRSASPGTGLSSSGTWQRGNSSTCFEIRKRDWHNRVQP